MCPRKKLLANNMLFVSNKKKLYNRKTLELQTLIRSQNVMMFIVTASR